MWFSELSKKGSDCRFFKSTRRYLPISHTYKHVLLRYITDRAYEEPIYSGLTSSDISKYKLRAPQTGKTIKQFMWILAVMERH